MTVIRAAYPNYYKGQAEIEDAINVWSEMLIEDDTVFTAKAVKEFIKNDRSGFPPSIGQIRGIAKDIKKMEWEARQRETDQLPAPKIERVEMPEELKNKLSKWMRTMN